MAIFIKLKARTPWVVVSDAKRAVIMDRQGFFLPLQENFRAWNIVGMDPGEIGKQTTEIEKLNILKEIEQWYNYYEIDNIFINFGIVILTRMRFSGRYN